MAAKKARKSPRPLHYKHTQLTVQHVLMMLRTWGPQTMRALRQPIADDLHRRGQSEANASDIATMRVNRALKRLKKPQIECLGIMFPYVMTTKSEDGVTVYSRFEDWHIDDIDEHLGIVADNRKEVRTAETVKQANYAVLYEEMNKRGVDTAGQLDFVWHFEDDEE